MTTLLGQIVLLALFSAALAAVVSGYRDEEPRQILRGLVRRTVHYALAVVAIGLAAQVVGAFFLRPR